MRFIKYSLQILFPLLTPTFYTTIFWGKLRNYKSEKFLENSNSLLPWILEIPWIHSSTFTPLVFIFKLVQELKKKEETSNKTYTLRLSWTYCSPSGNNALHSLGFTSWQYSGGIMGRGVQLVAYILIFPSSPQELNSIKRRRKGWVKRTIRLP